MKKGIALFFSILILTSLCSGYTIKEIYNKINNYENRALYLYEAYEDNELVFYEIKTRETKKGVRTENRIRRYDVDKLKKFIIYLQKRYDEQSYNNAILDYKENNENLVFLWDNAKLDPSYVLEEFCYELK